MIFFIIGGVCYVIGWAAGFTTCRVLVATSLQPVRVKTEDLYPRRDV